MLPPAATAGRTGVFRRLQGLGLRQVARLGPDSSRAFLSRSRAGQVPACIPFALVCASAVSLFSILAADVERSGFARIDPRRTRIDGLASFVDARWRTTLAGRLTALPAVSALDPRSVRRISDALAGLPFVAEIGEPCVVWPDGYEIPIRLRSPVACVRVRDEYFSISGEGVILPGAWSRPPWVAGGWLPVLGPNDRSFDRARPGTRLTEPRHLDALATAVSMRAALDPEDMEAMGPPLIDASHARQATVEDPGIALELEGRRLVLFGRRPDSGEPGELPTDLKWVALARALKLLRPETGAVKDWSVLDVRWDVPEIGWRAAEDEADARRPRPPSGRARGG